ncbi:MAG: electron transport complex subunit E [Clostridia bacterium]|nr:electron transport complex subunit E [Clostridia bacterium]
MKESKLTILTRGLIKENPVLVLVLGTCPVLATSTSVPNGFGMGIAATVVLICSNIVISALKKVIPDTVRIPCYIVVIASFVTVVQMLVKAYVPALNESLGIFLPLIVVNCIILGRAEMFANKNSIIDSAFDGIGMGLGFTIALVLMATIREVVGAGTWCGFEIPVFSTHTVSVLTMAPGGFFVFGLLIAILVKCTNGRAPKRKSFDCEGCPSAAACGKLGSTQESDSKKEEEEGVQ